ncbi:MAG: hypothetical protein R3C62_05795 [Chloroflexota bacterium]
MMLQKRPLGTSSIALGVLALLLSGGVMLVRQQGWLALYPIPFFVVATLPFFLALLGFIMGSTALFAREPGRLTAVSGLTLSLLTLCFTLYTLSTILPK